MSPLSIWQDRHPEPAEPGPAAVPLDGHAEVAVVGGGLTGTTTALLLARAGLGVTLVEAGRLGSGTTGRSTAKVSVLQGTRLSAIDRAQPARLVGHYVEANREAQAWVRRFCDDHGVGHDERDAYTFGFGEAGARAARREMALAERHGLPVSWVSEVPLPCANAGGVRLPDQLQLDPIELVDALAAEAVRHGVRVVEGHRVRSVTGSSPMTLRSDDGELTADRVVVATTMPILDRGAFFARMQASRSYGLALTVEPGSGVSAQFLSADAPSRSLRDADDGATLLVGGDGHPTGSHHPASVHLEALRAWTREHWPDAVETHAWSAQDHVPARGLPYAGPILPGRDDLLVAGGYAKWGLTNGVAAALAITGRLTGGHLGWAAAYDPWRPGVNVGGLPKGLAANARVGLEMTEGWIRPFLAGRDSPDLAADLAEGEGRVVTGRGLRPTGVARTDGVVHRVSGVCTHLGGVVRWNDAERSWDCPLHGSRFAADGSVLDAPATCGLVRRDG